MILYKHTFAFLFVLLFGLPLIAQNYIDKNSASKKLQKQFSEVIGQARNGKMKEALARLDKIVASEPGFIDAYILKGKLQHDAGLLEDAEKNLEKAIGIDPQYDVSNFYFLALVEWKLDKFSEAAQHFETFSQSEGIRDYLKERAIRYLANAEFAAEAIQNPVPYNAKPLSNQINTSEGEYWPTVTADKSLLIYTKRVKGQEDLYFSQYIDGEWVAGRPLQGLNSSLNEGTQSISADGRSLVFTACNRREGMGSCDLYYVQINGNYFTAPVNMGSPVNSSAWDSQSSLSADGKTLYFASERAGGLGDRDIWKSEQQADGSWGKPVNLGPDINTSQGDQAPFIHPDGQTLYFMSNGHPGMGGFDLYISRRQADGSWGKPQNLGYPINTKANEGAIFVSLDGAKAYFTSDKGDGDAREQKMLGRNNQDIYYFDLPPAIQPQAVTYVKARVYDIETKEPLVANAEITALESGLGMVKQKTNPEGGFLICLPAGRDYSLNVNKEGYLFYSEHFALREMTEGEPYLLDIPLQPLPQSNETEKLQKNEPIILKNVFFETASADLKPTSLNELDRLKVLLEKNPDLRIQINGHTDDVGSDADNQALSEARARAVHDYLLDAGIASDRLAYKGFGESQPIADNETGEGRRQNRRTEFVIVE